MHMSSLALCRGTMLIPPSKYLRSRGFLVSYQQRCALIGFEKIYPGICFPTLALSSVHKSRCWSWILSSMEAGRGSNPSESSTNQVTRLIGTIQSFQTKLNTQIKKLKKSLSIKIFFFLVGVYCATAFATVIGQSGDWDILSAGLAVVVVEGIGPLMYRASLPFVDKMKNLITFFNYWKAGLSLGLFFDAFKY